MKKKTYTLTKQEKSSLEYNGIKFRSPLEIICYKILEQSGLKFKYEPVTFEFQEKFIYLAEIWDRNGNGNFKAIRTNIIQPITHTPDFIVENDFIIEVKGFPTPDFLLKKKMLLCQLHKTKPKHYFMVHKIIEIFVSLERIKELINQNPKLV